MTGWGVDWAVFSYYKVSVAGSISFSFVLAGFEPVMVLKRPFSLLRRVFSQVFAPHLSVLYVSPSTLPLLSSLGHYFHCKDAYHLLAPGGASYELQHSVSRVLPYVVSLSSLSKTASDSEHLDNAWARISAHEKLLGEKLLGWLNGEEARSWGVRVVGPGAMDDGRGAVTVAFVVVETDERGVYGEVKVKKSSREVVGVFDQEGGVRRVVSVSLARVVADLSLPLDLPLLDRNQVWTRMFHLPPTLPAPARSLKPFSVFFPSPLSLSVLYLLLAYSPSFPSSTPPASSPASASAPSKPPLRTELSASPSFTTTPSRRSTGSWRG